MQCQRCKFENIPGQETCIKCGSVLGSKSLAFGINPPRMPKWKRPFRTFFRSIRASKLLPDTKSRLNIPSWLKDVDKDKTVGLILCIIPGLAHLVNGRFKQVRYYFVAWLILLLSGIFLYGSQAGFICIGLAIGVHIGISIQYGFSEALDSLVEKAAFVIIMLLALMMIYRFVPRILLPSITGNYSTLTIPYYNINEGDYLLTSTNIDRGEGLARGSLVVVNPVVIGGHQIIMGMPGQNTAVGQIIALPGENVQISNGVFIVNGQALDSEQYPVPPWLKTRSYSVTIPSDNYFVSLRYNVAAHGVVVTSSDIGQVCLYNKSQIQARAFMRWLPVSKRGFLY